MVNKLKVLLRKFGKVKEVKTFETHNTCKVVEEYSGKTPMSCSWCVGMAYQAWFSGCDL